MKHVTVPSPMSFIVGAILMSGFSANAAKLGIYASPSHAHPNCIQTPSEIDAHPELVEAAKAFGSLENVAGTWKLTGIPLVSKVISFSYTNNGFYVQNADGARKQASLCAHTDGKARQAIRVAVHQPSCPENRNIYIRAGSPGEMVISAYQTKSIGAVRFRRKSATPLPAGTLAPLVCAQD